MIGAGSLDYAHARIWARHGQRPDEALWRRIETTRDGAAVLELARGSALARWLAGVGPTLDVHGIETTLRRQWREQVAELASWLPPQWTAAVDWCAWLLELPALQHLARGGAALPWMAGDAWLGGLVGDDPVHAPARRLLDAARADPQALLRLWRLQWLLLLPRGGAGRSVAEQLGPMMAAHEAAFAAPATVDGWALRRGLQRRLELLLRRTVGEPTSAFVHLALSALEFERLRGELLRRAAFPQRPLAS